MKTFKQIARQALSLGIAALMTFGLIACGGTTTSETSTETTETSGVASSTAAEATATAETPSDKVFKIGVIQFADHPSLKNCYDGFLEGLKEAGFEVGKNIEVDYQVGQANMDIVNQVTASFVSKRYDLIMGIATPAAQSAYNAASVKGIPVVFNAVSDPIAAELQNADGSNKKGVTGTSDVLPVVQQLELIRAFLPEAKTVGILYNLAEANSVSTIKTYETEAAAFGFEIVTQGINAAADVPAAAESLSSKVDCITNLTDNLVVQNLQTVLSKTSAKNIPYFGSEKEQVTNGCTAAMGIDYVKLGAQTGEMAAQILNGSAAESIPVAAIKEASPFYNSKALAALGLSLPDKYKESLVDVAP